MKINSNNQRKQVDWQTAISILMASDANFKKVYTERYSGLSKTNAVKKFRKEMREALIGFDENQLKILQKSNWISANKTALDFHGIDYEITAK